MTQAIYVFKAPDRVKVGISNCPTRRLVDLSYQTDDPLAFAFAASTNGKRACDLERRAHKILDPHWIGGEWFSVTVEAAIAAIMQAANELGYELRERGEIDDEDQNNESITLRLPRDILRAIDDARRIMDPIPSRQDIIRLAVIEWLQAREPQ